MSVSEKRLGANGKPSAPVTATWQVPKASEALEVALKLLIEGEVSRRERGSPGRGGSAQFECVSQHLAMVAGGGVRA